MDTLVRIISRIIIFIIFLILVNWLLLDISPNHTWNRLVRTFNRWTGTGVQVTKDTGKEAGRLINAASSVDDTLVQRAAEKYDGK